VPVSPPRSVHLGIFPAQRLTALVPGVTICLVIALAAGFAAARTGTPPMLWALLLGTALHYLSQEVRTAPGVQLCGTMLLRLGVGLLGARVTAAQIAALGWGSVVVVLAAVATTLLVGLALARRLGLSTNAGVLAGGATAICGASAALAIAAVLPRDEKLERDTLVTVVLAALLSTAAMLAYPLAARALHLSPSAAGLFLGGSIHDVAQVVVAGYALDADTGNAASLVKLLRVSLLAAVVAGVAMAMRGPGAAPGRWPRPLLPGFLLLFLGLALLQSTMGLPDALRWALGEGSQACLMMGVAALGMKTSFAALRSAGWRPALLMLGTTAWIALFVLAAVLAPAFRAA
jgi:uncharacterized integral membrane protein (TIGR00698 family)